MLYVVHLPYAGINLFRCCGYYLSPDVYNQSTPSDAVNCFYSTAKIGMK